MDLNGGNRARVDVNVNPNSAHVGDRRQKPLGKNEKPLTKEQRLKYREAQIKYSSRQEHREPEELRRTSVPGKVKDRADVEDCLFKSLSAGLIKLENNYGLDEKLPNGTRVKDLPIKEFYAYVGKRISHTSIAKKAEINRNAAPYVGMLQTCLNYMEYYKIIKIKFDVLDGCQEVCKVLDSLRCESGKRDAVMRLNVLLAALHRNDMRGAKSVSVPSYRFLRMICVFIMYRDFISASVFSRMVFGQILLEDEIKKQKGEQNKDVRRNSQVWRTTKNQRLNYDA